MSLDRLAPDQRAVVQLVLQQGRSYDDLAGLLGISEEAVRGRAHAGLATLAGRSAPSSAGEVSDFLLGQQTVSQREATRALLASDEEANAWARAVAGELRDVAGDDLPELPAAATGGRRGGPAAEADEPVDTGTPLETPTGTLGRPQPRPRPRPAREAPRRRAAASAGRDAGDRDSAPVASRLGGVLLIAGLAILVAAILIFVVGGDGDGETTAGNGNGSANGDATATPTATGTPQPLGAVRLRAVEGQSGRGEMALYLDPSSGGALFAIQAQNVPDVTDGNAYAMWLTKESGDDPRLLGFFGERPRGKKNVIAATGPQEADVTKFAGWLTEYDHIVLSQESVERPAAPTTPVLQGDLPRSEG